jgi:hypothetical protein
MMGSLKPSCQGLPLYCSLRVLTLLPCCVLQSAIFLFVEHPYDVGDLLGMPDSSMARVKKVSRAASGCAHGCASSSYKLRRHSRAAGPQLQSKTAC